MDTQESSSQGSSPQRISSNNGYYLSRTEIIYSQPSYQLYYDYVILPIENTIEGKLYGVRNGVEYQIDEGAADTASADDGTSIEIKYNEYGDRIADRIFSNIDSSRYSSSNTYSYNNLGLLVESEFNEIYDDSFVSKQQIWFYDTDSNLVKSEIFNTDNVKTLVNRTTFELGDNGKPKSSRLENIAIGSETISTFEYNQGNQLISVSMDFGQKIDFEYDTVGNLSRQTLYSPNGSLDTITNYTYEETVEPVYNFGIWTLQYMERAQQ